MISHSRDIVLDVLPHSRHLPLAIFRSKTLLLRFALLDFPFRQTFAENKDFEWLNVNCLLILSILRVQGRRL